MGTLNSLPTFSPPISKLLAARTSRTTAEDSDGVAAANSPEDVDYEELPMSISESVSVTEDLNQERLQHEQSFDDQILQEANKVVEEKRRWFERQKKEVLKIVRKNFEKDRQRRLKQNLEATRLWEMRMLVLFVWHNI